MTDGLCGSRVVHNAVVCGRMGRAGLVRAFAHSGFNLSSFSIISFRSAVSLRRRPESHGLHVCLHSARCASVCNLVRPLTIETEKRSTHCQTAPTIMTPASSALIPQPSSNGRCSCGTLSGLVARPSPIAKAAQSGIEAVCCAHATRCTWHAWWMVARPGYVCPQCVGTAHAGLSRACSSACPRHRTLDRARESCTVTTPSSLPIAQTAHERRGDLCNVCAQGSLPRATHARARSPHPSTCVFLPRHRSLPPPVRRSSCRRVRSLANMRRRTRLQAHPHGHATGLSGQRQAEHSRL
jgi:hypothetical protein